MSDSTLRHFQVLTLLLPPVVLLKDDIPLPWRWWVVGVACAAPLLTGVIAIILSKRQERSGE